MPADRAHAYAQESFTVDPIEEGSRVFLPGDFSEAKALIVEVRATRAVATETALGLDFVVMDSRDDELWWTIPSTPPAGEIKPESLSGIVRARAPFGPHLALRFYGSAPAPRFEVVTIIVASFA